jgi:transposase InsO family protein
MTSIFASNGPQPFTSSTHQRLTFGQHFFWDITTVVTIAEVFFQHIYKLHGLPAAIVSDRDKILTSNFWKELFKQAGFNLHMSSSYHPQSDDQIERVN